MNRFNLALRMLWRDSRSGELTILVLALMVAVSSSTAIALFANRLQSTMALQAAEFLAGDLIIESPSPLSGDWQEKATQLILNQSFTVEFSSVLIEHEQLLLSGVKAVSATYPLRGVLKTTDADYSSEAEAHLGPSPGSVWVEKRVLSSLNLNLGDTVTIGEKPLIIKKIIIYEPDKRGDFYSFAPRVLMNTDDLAATKVVQPGSRVHYFYQFTGEPEALAAFKDWAKPQLNASQRLMDIHEDRPELGKTLERAERYMGLASVVVILIAGVAIAMATRRYTERHFNATAILRCLGCKQREIVVLYGLQFLVLGVVACTLATLIGWFAQQGLFYLLKEFLPKQIVAPDWFALLFGFGLGFLVLMGFALPPLLRLAEVSPLRVLRRELEPLPTSAWVVYGLALAVATLLIGHFTDDFKMTATVVGGGLLSLLVLVILVYALLAVLEKLLPSLSISWRFGLKGLLRNRSMTISQVLAFCITLVAMILCFTVRTDLLADWQKSMPKDAPNHFALNIFPPQLDGFKNQLKELHITSSQFYPVIRGRLVEINNEPVKQAVSKDSQGDNATRRDLSLTYTNAVPDDNKITDGEWWTGALPGLVSVEQKLADNLKIHVGDTLTFTIGSAQVKAKVTNLRTLEWNTMKPNFYMIFSPGTLDAYPSTFLTSFYLAPAQKNRLNTLLKKFPGTTILEVDLILQQIQTVLTQVTLAINYLLYFALLAGFTVLFAAVLATLDNRIYEGALLRTLGATRLFLRKTQVIEFSVLGLVSGLLAVFISEAIIYVLYTTLFHIDYHPALTLWVIVPPLGAGIVGLAAFMGLSDVVNKSPLRVLREL